MGNISKQKKLRKVHIRIIAECRQGITIKLPCNYITLGQLIDGTGICGKDGRKCQIVREIKREVGVRRR